MDEWFSEIAAVKNPGRNELQNFVNDATNFIGEVIQNQDNFGFLFADNPELLEEALETYEYDILASKNNLIETIPEISGEELETHGLVGRTLRFKFRVLDTITKGWNRIGERFSIKVWLKQVFDAINVILNSLVDAAGGVGGVVKEFKDALRALIPSS